jgi:hypothetical protein
MRTSVSALTTVASQDRLIPGQVYEVGYKVGVHFLLLAGAVDRAKPKFDIVRVRKNQMVGGRAIPRAVAPIDAKKWHARALCQCKRRWLRDDLRRL